jgi:rare lipoprotein A
MRGNVPMPEERPYSLGNTVADASSANATSEMSSSHVARIDRAPLENARAVSYGGRSHMAASRVVDAYAPVERQESPREILSGRGLY